VTLSLEIQKNISQVFSLSLEGVGNWRGKKMLKKTFLWQNKFACRTAHSLLLVVTFSSIAGNLQSSFLPISVCANCGIGNSLPQCNKQVSIQASLFLVNAKCVA
jgi:hypothetical protein